MLHVTVENWTNILFLCRNFRKGDRDALWRNHYSSAVSQLTLHVASHIAIHNWVIHVQHFKTKGGFPPPRNFSVRTRVKKNRGYVWKATQKRKRKSWTSLNSYVYARPFIHCLYFIHVRKIYQSSHRKLTRQWKSTLTDLINREGTVVYSVRAVGRSVVRLPAFCSLHRRHRRVAITETTCLT